MTEQMAFAGDVETEMGTMSESGFSLQNATISVSTLVMLAAAAVAVWTMRWCFWKLFGAKKEVQREQEEMISNYGTL